MIIFKNLSLWCERIEHECNTEPNVKFNVGLLKKDNYEKEIERLGFFIYILKFLSCSKYQCW